MAVGEKADCQTAFLTATCFTLDAVLAAISHRHVERIMDCSLDDIEFKASNIDSSSPIHGIRLEIVYVARHHCGKTTRDISSPGAALEVRLLD